jgi:hypothetical protein
VSVGLSPWSDVPSPRTKVRTSLEPARGFAVKPRRVTRIH